MKEIEELKTFVNNLAYHHAISGSTCNELISKLDKVSNSELKPLLGKASSQPGAVAEMNNQLENGRHYLMSVQPKDLTVEDALEAFGFGRNGLS